MSSAEVLLIIAAFDGGFNGDVPDKEIGVEILSSTEAIYTLTHWVDGVRTDTVEQYRLALVEETYVPPVVPGGEGEMSEVTPEAPEEAAPALEEPTL